MAWGSYVEDRQGNSDEYPYAENFRLGSALLDKIVDVPKAHDYWRGGGRRGGVTRVIVILSVYDVAN